MTIETYDAWLDEVQARRDELLMLSQQSSQPTLQDLEDADRMWAATDAEADAPFILQAEE